MKKSICVLVFATIIMVCGVVLAGPLANTSQFQQKAAYNAAQRNYDRNSSTTGEDTGSNVTVAQDSVNIDIVNVNNKICPVTGEKVNGQDFSSYKGRRYGFCCSACPAKFASDPEKYAAIADKEVAGT